MHNLFGEIDARAIAVVLALMMGCGWGIGRWRTRRWNKAKVEGMSGHLASASVALLGLLLSFTFSMSLQRHEHRRQMVVEHANTIGDFTMCVSMLKEPVRVQLHGVIRNYVEHLSAIPKSHLTEAELLKDLDFNQRLHTEMGALVKVAVDDGTPIAISLLNTLNNVTSSHDRRLAAFRDRLPASIMVLLFLSAMVSMTQVGMQHIQLDERELTTGLGFILLVSLSVWVTLDLNQPQSGTIRVSQEPMQRLLSSLR